MNESGDMNRRLKFQTLPNADKVVTNRMEESVTYESRTMIEGCSVVNFNNTLVVDREEVKNFTDCDVVIFDLETSGFESDAEILQIAALANDDRPFNVYIKPSRPISFHASSVTGLTEINGNLYLHHRRVQARSARKAVMKFIEYLQKFEKKIILLAHNGFRFDVPRIISLIKELDLLNEFASVVNGFADSLPISKTFLPQRVKEKRKFSIGALAADFLPEECTESLHDAVEDVKMLRKLLRKIGINDINIQSNSKSLNKILKEEEKKTEILFNKLSLREFNDCITKYMINKIAKADINKRILLKAFMKSGHVGLTELLSENVNGKARVTSDKKVIESIYNFLKYNM